MAEEPLLTSGSDSDDDYVPQEVASELSEEESGSGSENEEVASKGKKRKSLRKKVSKKIKMIEEDKKEEVNPEEFKKKSDALWADFIKDVPNKKFDADEPGISSNEKDNAKTDDKVKTQVYKFAGKKVTVGTPLQARGRGRGGGISSILSQLDKKEKLSLLEKNKLDWEKFKAEVGINEEIKTHNRGKNGYLERQDFLERADLRQFEIEKRLRASKRKPL